MFECSNLVNTCHQLNICIIVHIHFKYLILNKLIMINIKYLYIIITIIN